MLKNLFFLVSILYTLTLTVVCLIKIDNVPDIGVSFGDKIFHSLTYALLSFLWYKTLLFRFKLNKKSALIYAAVFSIIFGIIIEILQGALTTSRACDVYDVIANSAGVFFTVLVVSIKNLITIKK